MDIWIQQDVLHRRRLIPAGRVYLVWPPSGWSFRTALTHVLFVFVEDILRNDTKWHCDSIPHFTVNACHRREGRWQELGGMMPMNSGSTRLLEHRFAHPALTIVRDCSILFVARHCNVLCSINYARLVPALQKRTISLRYRCLTRHIVLS